MCLHRRLSDEQFPYAVQLMLGLPYSHPVCVPEAIMLTLQGKPVMLLDMLCSGEMPRPSATTVSKIVFIFAF